jgi:hypothetical protein
VSAARGARDEHSTLARHGFWSQSHLKQPFATADWNVAEGWKPAIRLASDAGMTSPNAKSAFPIKQQYKSYQGIRQQEMTALPYHQALRTP